MVRRGPSLAFSAASLYLAAFASYFSALASRSSMALLPLRMSHSPEDRSGSCPPAQKDGEGWEILQRSRARLPQGPARRFSGLGGLVLQATPRGINLGIGRTMAARIGLRCGRRILRHIEANQAAGHPMHGAGVRGKTEG